MTTRRSLRLSIPAGLYAEIERLARITGTPVSKSAEYVLAFGLLAVDIATAPDGDDE